jgi:hypothetical protein
MAGAILSPKRRGKYKFRQSLDGGSLKETKNVEDLDLDGIIILKFSLNI